MKKIWYIGAGLVCIAVLAVSFTLNKGASSRTEVGVLMPFSENFAWWGEQMKDTIKIIQADGHSGGIEFVYADTKCETKEAVSAIQSLKLRHPSMHLFLVACDNDLMAMFPSMDRNKDVAFMLGLSDANLYKFGFPVINLAYRLEDEATAAASFAHKILGVSSLGIITDDQSFGGTLSSTAADYFSSVGGSAITERIKYNEKNPETSILKILHNKPDAVYLQNDIPGMSAILKRLAQLGYKGQRIVFYGGRDQSLIDTAGAAAEGVYVPWVMSDKPSSARESFEQEYKMAHGKEPFISAYFLYDGLVLLDEAITSCAVDTRCIEDYFYKKSDFKSMLGDVRYQPNGEVQRTFTFDQVKDGKFVEVK